MTVAQDFVRGLADAIRAGGTDGFLVYADTPNADPLPIRFLLNHPTQRDEAIVNAYGVNALVVTIPASPALLAKPPKKFDLVLLTEPPGDAPATPTVEGSAPYALDAVKLHQVLNVPVAFTAYIKGKGE